MEKCMCGGEPKSWKGIVECQRCTASTPEFPTTDEAIEAWNTMQPVLSTGDVVWANSQLLRGHKITAEGWRDNEFLYLKENTILDESGKPFDFNGIFTCGGWKIYNPTED